MIHGAHAIVYSRQPEADRAFLRDVLGLSWVDAGGGWLIFGLPPAEVAVHPSRRNDAHELYFLCDDVETFVAAMKKKRIKCSPVQDLLWGRLTQVKLPGGGELGVYQPRHARPAPGRAAKKGARKAVGKSAGKSAAGRAGRASPKRNSKAAGRGTRTTKGAARRRRTT